MAAPFTAPSTRLNARLTPQRNVAFARLDLDDVKRVKDHFGVSVNDVAMALVSGVVRKFLLDRGELPGPSLVALVPVSVHEPTEDRGRNQVSGMFVRLQTQIADPVKRLTALAEATTAAKEHAAAIDSTLLQDFGQIAGPVILGIAKRVYARLTRFRPMYNLVVSNVPGPRMPYFLGAEVLAVYPFGPVHARLRAQRHDVVGQREPPRQPDLVLRSCYPTCGTGRRLRRELEGTAGRDRSEHSVPFSTPSPTRSGTG